MKNKFVSIKNWKPYEITWLITFMSVAVFLTIIWQDNVFGLTVFVTGVLCVVLAAKGNIATYIFGIYNTFGYAYLAWNNNLYGEVSLNLLFFVPMNIIGFILWNKKMDGGIVQMKALTKKGITLTCILCVLCILVLGFGLSLIPGQNNPYIDAATNVLSIIATFLMVWRYREQWLLYMILNVCTVILWGLRTINGSPDGAMMVVMWSAYLLNAIYGYINWSKGSKKKEAST